MRRLIARLFTHNANTVWERYLQDIALAKNASWNRSIKAAAVHVYIPERPAVDAESRVQREGRIFPGIARLTNNGLQITKMRMIIMRAIRFESE